MKLTKAKKSLGQNFLVDTAVVDRIATVAMVQPQDWVLEIGPGRGALTHAVAGRVARYLAIELDHELATHLQAQFRDSSSVCIMEGDILDVHLEKMLREAGYEEHLYKLIANIPYYITAPIIRTMLALTVQPQSLTLMVQKEVAKRLVAKPGSMSLLSLMAQYYATVEIQFLVPKEAFDPVPKVESAVISLIPRRRYDADKDKQLFRLARAGFSARRKTLANNLASSFLLSRDVVNEKLRQAGLSSDVRAQALAVTDWEQLVLLWGDAGQ